MSPETSIYAYLEKPSMVDYPKHFAAVFFISGCGFSCGFCHNAKLIGKKQTGLSWQKLETAATRFKKEWVNGIVITGGEPTGAADLMELVRFFKERFGFPIKLDTNGSDPDHLEKCMPLVDYVAMDIKCGLSTYPELAGFEDTGKIKASIELIRNHAKDYEFRTTVIESVHTDREMESVQELVAGSKRYALQAFIPRPELPDTGFCEMPRTTSARLHTLKDRMNGCADEILLRGA